MTYITTNKVIYEVIYATFWHSDDYRVDLLVHTMDMLKIVKS
jgi:hypothetical protein